MTDYSFQVEMLISALRDIQSEIAYIGKELRLAREGRDSTPPAGSASPSTEAARPEASGRAGRCRARDIDGRRCELKSGHLEASPHMARGVEWVQIEPDAAVLTEPAHGRTGDAR